MMIPNLLIQNRLTLQFLFLILVILPWGSAHSESPGENQNPSMVQAHLQKGFRHLKKERYKKAIEELEIARKLSRDPCVRCLKGIALAYYRSEQFEEAVKAYEELFEVEPEVRSVLRRLVQLYDRVGTPEKSIAAYETFLESSDKPGEMIAIYNELGVRRLTPESSLTIHRGDAATAFRCALDLAAGRSNLLRRNLAEALWQLGSKDEALAVLDGLAEEDEGSWGLLPAIERNPELLKRESRIRSTWAGPAWSTPGEFAFSSPCSRGGKPTSFAEPLFVGGDIRPPEEVFSPQPQYTRIARKARIQGTVIVQAIIDEQGCVRATRILKALSMGLDEQSLIAIRKWRFAPATLQGKPVAVYYDLTVNFRLQ